MTDQMKIPNPTPNLTEAMIEEGLRSAVRVGEAFTWIGSFGMVAAFLLAVAVAEAWVIVPFVFALLFTLAGAANRRQAIKVLRKAGYDA